MCVCAHEQTTLTPGCEKGEERAPVKGKLQRIETLLVRNSLSAGFLSHADDFCEEENEVPRRSQSVNW